MSNNSSGYGSFGSGTVCVLEALGRNRQELRAQASEAKQAICSGISRQLESLRSREVHLLSQVDAAMRAKDDLLIARILKPLEGVALLGSISQEYCRDDDERETSAEAMRDLVLIKFEHNAQLLQKAIHDYGAVEVATPIEDVGFKVRVQHRLAAASADTVADWLLAGSVECPQTHRHSEEQPHQKVNAYLDLLLHDKDTSRWLSMRQTPTAVVAEAPKAVVCKSTGVTCRNPMTGDYRRWLFSAMESLHASQKGQHEQLAVWLLQQDEGNGGRSFDPVLQHLHKLKASRNSLWLHSAAVMSSNSEDSRRLSKQQTQSHASLPKQLDLWLHSSTTLPSCEYGKQVSTHQSHSRESLEKRHTLWPQFSPTTPRCKYSKWLSQQQSQSPLSSELQPCTQHEDSEKCTAGHADLMTWLPGACKNYEARVSHSPHSPSNVHHLEEIRCGRSDVWLQQRNGHGVHGNLNHLDGQSGSEE